MKGKLGDIVRLQHVLDAIHEVEIYLEGVTLQQFLENSEKRFATISKLKLLAKHVMH